MAGTYRSLAAFSPDATISCSSSGMNAPINPSPFHDGEVRAHAAAGTGTPGAAIREQMPDQHRQFFSSLRFAMLATTDNDGWPVATIVTGPQGFITSDDPQSLKIAATAYWQYLILQFCCLAGAGILLYFPWLLCALCFLWYR